MIESLPECSAKLTFTMRNAAILHFAVAAAAIGCADRGSPPQNEAKEPAATATDPVSALMEERSQLDATVFADETEAQRHEATIVKFWDALRTGNAFDVLRRFPCESFKIGTPTPAPGTDWGLPGLRAARLQQPDRELNHDEFVTLLNDLEKQGWHIKQSEWHHSQFEPASNDAAARSTIGFEIHAIHGSETQRVVIRGDLLITWSGNDDASGDPIAEEIQTADVQLVGRNGPLVFRERLTVDPRTAAPNRFPRTSPILLHDLNSDGLPEVILGGCNLVYWNRGDFQFESGDFLSLPVGRPAEAGLLADFTGDGIVDYVTASTDAVGLLLFAGSEEGHFRDAPLVCFSEPLQNLHALTAGDVDADGDLDLFAGQWKAPYVDGTMPTPFYDANDGHPDFLLINEGDGRFTDGTVDAGLAAKRNRRTFSASFIDLDEDQDLDLVVVADFSGLDIYLNDDGKFREVTSDIASHRHGFGMSHAFGDFNDDGHTDIYMVGMSSTTARRLDRLGASRPQRDDYTRMRAPMAFGNRILLKSGGKFVQSQRASSAARTGWSWGCAARDFDLDGDTDIYVANGHLSGSSAQDYCTKFWCHDLYTGASEPDADIDLFFKQSLGTKLGRDLSWNGFEHNALLLNEPGWQFFNAAFHFGVAFEYDSRAVATGDLDADGRPDLAVVEYRTDTMSQRLHILQNKIESDRHWIGVRFRSDPAGRSSSPIGAKVTVKSGNRTWVRQVASGESFTAQHERTAHVGLGPVEIVDVVEIRWPSGHVTRIDNPGIDQYHWAESPR